MKKLLSAFLILASSINVSANEVEKSEITYISPWEDHIDIQTSGTKIDPDNCGDKNLYRIDLHNDNGASEKLSVLLSAFMAGKPVGLRLKGCVGDKPKIFGVRLYK
ncbi:MAG: hypothetical protein MK185_10515 [Saccharospirillaceae bacterium]|nr:hypothetical protein A3759_18155 [Thalassolituus sp. HI0120]MCH2041054.1 hypothetical protein [Saccharospirillaceae bacterium]